MERGRYRVPEELIAKAGTKLPPITCIKFLETRFGRGL